MISATNQLDVRIDYQPTGFDNMVKEFNRLYPQIGDTISNTHVDKNVVSMCRKYLGQ